jgi:hypothetical protein
VDDRRKRQTFAATPAEPGDLPWGVRCLVKGRHFGGLLLFVTFSRFAFSPCSQVSRSSNAGAFISSDLVERFGRCVYDGDSLASLLAH